MNGAAALAEHRRSFGVTDTALRWAVADGRLGGPRGHDTYILLANPSSPGYFVGLRSRVTIHVDQIEGLEDVSASVKVESTDKLPLIVERSMFWDGNYYGGHTGQRRRETREEVDVRGRLPGRLLRHLHPDRQRERDPGDGDVHVGDARLKNAALSTVVQSNVPIVSERSMYWEGDVAGKLGEGHNSSGVTETGLRWGLAEGRVGGDREFITYILLANPAARKADVRITYLREGGAPIVKEYEVPATSRYNVDVNTVVPELQNASFGAIIEVLNNVPIAVERSLYWNANGAIWAGGTNALATRLPPIE